LPYPNCFFPGAEVVRGGKISNADWQHIVCVSDPDGPQPFSAIYQNGICIEKQPRAFSPAPGLLTGLILGSTTFDGGLAEVRIFRRALGVEEIASRFKSYTPTHPIAYMPDAAASAAVDPSLFLNLEPHPFFVRDTVTGSTSGLNASEYQGIRTILTATPAAQGGVTAVPGRGPPAGPSGAQGPPLGPTAAF